MSVLLETSAGELVVDLFVEEAPLAAKNFLKLCKIKYYHGCLFFNVQTNFIAQCGDPSGTGKGGMSIYGHMYGPQAAAFADEIHPAGRKHDKLGLLCMANTGPDSNKSQFFITLRGEDLQHLDGKHTIVGEVAEGFETLDTINNLFCDEDGRPYQDVRIKHTHILDDPFPDPPQLEVPPSSPVRAHPDEERVGQRIPFEESLETVSGERTEAELEESIKRKEAHSRAIVLEMTGDIPDAEVKPPEEVLFVCKLNPVTTDDDLEVIFSRFGKIKKCEIIRDFKTGDSLNYAFIEFETEDACIEAYEKMNNVLIDDRRIKVDFSQSVTKLWNKYLMKPAQHQKDVERGKPREYNSSNLPRGSNEGSKVGPPPSRSNLIMKNSNQYQLLSGGRKDSYLGASGRAERHEAKHHDRDRARKSRSRERGISHGKNRHRSRSRSTYEDRSSHRHRSRDARDDHGRRDTDKHSGERKSRGNRSRSRSRSPCRHERVKSHHSRY